ncbi:MAG TPA: hypothetical protein IGS52_02575 [Oscillatoriaceae cyanobacterium M33_DOE_052]|nr:hypothetical protein [Oscillatoriaceae cyanobacterium M33_DOE_052]
MTIIETEGTFCKTETGNMRGSQKPGFCDSCCIIAEILVFVTRFLA